MFGENGEEKDEGLIWTTCRDLLRQLNENINQESIVFLLMSQLLRSITIKHEIY